MIRYKMDCCLKVFCWAHVERAIETHLPGKGDKYDSKRKKVREAILDDIRLFQHHSEFENWIPIGRLLINKWNANDYPKEFIDYFMTNWLKPHKIGWIDHFCDWVPCQTNGIESTNRYVKDDGTRERLSMVEFLKVLESVFLHKWSKNRNKTLKRTINEVEVVEENKKFVPFWTEPEVKLKDFTVSYQWNEQNKSFKKYKGFVCVPAGKTTLTSDECEEYFRQRKEAKWNSFDQAISHNLYFINKNEENWKLSKCSCYWWSKNYICKHVIAVAFRSRLLAAYPDECKDVAIGCKRKRGRPKKNRGALFRLEDEKICEDEEAFSFSESDSDNEIENENENEEKKKRGRKRKIKATTVEENDTFDLFAEIDLTTNVAANNNILNDVTHCKNNTSPNAKKKKISHTVENVNTLRRSARHKN